MNKKAILAIIAAVALLAAVYYAGHVYEAWKQQPPPPAAGPATPPPQPEKPQLQPQPEKPPAAAGQPRTGQMRLEPEPKEEPAEQTAGFAESRKKESDKTILPGVTLNPGGQGVCIQLADKNETIQLKRNASESTDYQMMWQKKF